jgi:hypothetical protein
MSPTANHLCRRSHQVKSGNRFVMPPLVALAPLPSQESATLLAPESETLAAPESATLAAPESATLV